MRLVGLFALMLAAAAGPACAQAYETPKEIMLSDTARIQGVVGSGQQQAYVLKSRSDGSIAFDIQADSDSCGFEVKTSARRGFLTSARRFPVHFVTPVQQGETYTISFFQSRTSWIAKSTCSYAFTARRSD